MSKDKSAEEVLFPEVKIGDIEVKPWSFGVLFSISGMLERILDKMEEKGLDLGSEDVGVFIDYRKMARLFTIASPEVLKIISLTVDKSEEELKELPIDTGIKIAITIYAQNMEIIKNAISSALPQIELKTETEPTQEEN